jgi:hypothetical protein
MRMFWNLKLSIQNDDCAQSFSDSDMPAPIDTELVNFARRPALFQSEIEVLKNLFLVIAFFLPPSVRNQPARFARI